MNIVVMDANSKPIGLAVLLLLLLVGLQLRRGGSSTVFHCIEEEREALLDFKSGLVDTGNHLSSWVVGDDECCRWEGVRCNNLTGRVERLHLRRSQLGGEIRPSLLALTHLKHLDLSHNNFGVISIPGFLGSFKKLRYLDLSVGGFVGRVPPELGNLSTLRHLDLLSNIGLLHVEDTRWLSSLTSLRYLDMSNVMFQKESSKNWLHALNMLPSILEIRLFGCALDGRLPTSLPHNNLTSLSILQLGQNNINSTIPEWLGSLTSLEILSLGWCKFYGPIPAALGNLTSLQYFDLIENAYISGEIPKTLGNLCNLSTFRLSGFGVSGYLNELSDVFSGCMRNNLENLILIDTNLTGHLPDWLGGLTSLQDLFVADSNMNGPVPKVLGGLYNLVVLRLDSNNLEGIISEEHFINLTKLKILGLSDNPLLAMRVSSDWNPPFQLNGCFMSSCQLGPKIPAWIRTQDAWVELHMSKAGISDTIPDWLVSSSARFDVLDLSHNKIGGNFQSLATNGAVGLLDLSDNLISGPIPPNLGEAMPYLVYLFLSMNHINGTIPLFFCKMEGLVALDLSKNFLSGELPKCWGNPSSLKVLDLSNNNLSGWIPGSIFTLSNLRSLHLGSNIMTGELPVSLSNCTTLVVLDLSGNKFNGSISPAIGEYLTSLKILSLHSNMLSGSIPQQLSNLGVLQILDLSHNQLSGFIPESFGNFTAMKFNHNISETFISVLFYMENLMLSMKGRELLYDSRLLSIVLTIDLSDNSLSGSLPKELGNLIGLDNLNLSGNQLSGEIIDFGEMRQLETLDLSRNKFSGRIPSSLSTLYSLNHLNLSYNNLTGRIPSGDQLQTLDDPSIYIGNDDLCGPPLVKKCPDDEASPTVEDGFNTEEETEESNEILWIFSGMAPGFVVGLSALFGLLVLKREWRIAYFRFIDYVYDTIYVAIAININKWKRWKLKISNRRLTRRN